MEKISKVQELQFELMKKASFNNFDAIEAINEVLESESQMIRMYVSEDKELKIINN